MKKGLLAVWLLMAAAVTISAQDADSKYARDLLAVGTVAPDIVGANGNTISMENYRGRCVVLDFWATWCPDCRKDIPKMKELYAQYHKEGVAFVGVSFDTNQEVLDNYLKKESIRWQQVSELKKWKETQTSKDYHISWIPTMYLLDTDGRVLLATVEIDKLQKKLEELQKTGQLVKTQ